VKCSQGAQATSTGDVLKYVLLGVLTVGAAIAHTHMCTRDVLYEQLYGQASGFVLRRATLVGSQ